MDRTARQVLRLELGLQALRFATNLLSEVTTVVSGDARTTLVVALSGLGRVELALRNEIASLEARDEKALPEGIRPQPKCGCGSDECDGGYGVG